MGVQTFHVCVWHTDRRGTLRGLLPPPPLCAGLNLPRSPYALCNKESLSPCWGGGGRGLLAAGGTPPFSPPASGLLSCASSRCQEAAQRSPRIPELCVPGTAPLRGPLRWPHRRGGDGSRPHFAAQGGDTARPRAIPGLGSFPVRQRRVRSPLLMGMGMGLERGQAVPPAADSFCS